MSRSIIILIAFYCISCARYNCTIKKMYTPEFLGPLPSDNQPQGVSKANTIIADADSALKSGDALAMREAFDQLSSYLNQPDGDVSDTLVKELENKRDNLRKALREEVVERVEEAHGLALIQKNLKSSMKQWQVASFYLGLLPEADSPDTASTYQEYLTEHEQIKDKIGALARIKYAQWAVEQMKKYVAAFSEAKDLVNDDEDKMVASGIKYLGPIDTSVLTVEAIDLYRSLLQATFGELNMTQQSDMIEGIEKYTKIMLLDFSTSKVSSAKIEIPK